MSKINQVKVDKYSVVSIVADYLNKFDFIDFSLLFGSFAGDEANKLSDIDIGILINKDISLIQVGVLSANLEALLKYQIDLVILNDMYKKNPALAFEVVSKGKLIFCKNYEKFIEFRKNSFLYFMDIKRLRDKINKAFMERLKSNKFGESDYVGTAETTGR